MVEHADARGIAPLRAAAQYGHHGTVHALLQAGARVDHADLKGRTPFGAAVQFAHYATALLLLNNSANTTASCRSQGSISLVLCSLDCTP
jgi:ankyrin repeat protein